MAKIQCRMIGVCPRCGKEFIRPFECDVAACDCESATVVPLQPVLLLPPRMYKRFENIAKRLGMPIDTLVNKVLETMLDDPEVIRAIRAVL